MSRAAGTAVPTAVPPETRIAHLVAPERAITKAVNY